MVIFICLFIVYWCVDGNEMIFHCISRYSIFIWFLLRVILVDGLVIEWWWLMGDFGTIFRGLLFFFNSFWTV
jgi:hypothetical protein